MNAPITRSVMSTINTYVCTFPEMPRLLYLRLLLPREGRPDRIRYLMLSPSSKMIARPTAEKLTRGVLR